MKPLENITKSPLSNADLIPDLSCIDYTVSHQKFNLVKDKLSNLLITSPRPASNDLMSYYESISYISHTDSKLTVFDKVYQSIRKYTTKRKVAKIDKAKYSDIKNILDIGCGTGDFLSACTKKKWRVFGVEPHNQARAISIEKTKTNDIYTSIEALEALYPNQKFDVITLWHVLEHVPNLEEYIQALKRLLHPNGILIIAVPNFMSYDAQYYQSYWAAFDVPRHLWHFSPTAIKILFAKVDMTVIKIWPMYFDSFYISILSEKNINLKGNFIRAFFIGLFSNIKALFTNNYSSVSYLIQNKPI